MSHKRKERRKRRRHALELNSDPLKGETSKAHVFLHVHVSESETKGHKLRRKLPKEGEGREISFNSRQVA